MQSPTEQMQVPLPPVQTREEAPAPLLDTTLTFAPPGATPELSEAFQPVLAPTEATGSPIAGGVWPPSPAVEPAREAPGDDAATSFARPIVHRSGRRSWALALFVIPLITYAILATIAVIILYLRPQPPHPLETLPDEGPDRGARHQKANALRIGRPR